MPLGVIGNELLFNAVLWGSVAYLVGI